jgi:hypothetical protein
VFSPKFSSLILSKKEQNVSQKENPVDFSVKKMCFLEQKLATFEKLKIQKKKGRKKKLQLDSCPKIKEFKLNYG